MDKFDVAGLHFTNVTQAKNTIQALIQSCPEGGIVPDAANVLKQLFEESPYYDPAKMRWGYKFRVRKKMHVEIVGLGFDTFRFGWNGFIKAKAHHTRVKHAARDAIKHQRPPRDIARHPNCAICGIAFTASDDTHWDHANISFDIIWNAFLIYEEITIDDVGIDKKTRQFTDLQLHDRWVDHHKQFVEWQLTHAKCNLSKKST